MKGLTIGTLNYATSNFDNNFASDYLFETTSFHRMITSSTNSSTWSNSLVITVVPTPIISNTISANASIMADGSYEVGVNDPIEFSGVNSKVNLNVLSNPFHTVVRSDPYANVDSYQWQYKSGLSNGKWTDISNATLPTLSGFSLSMVQNNNSLDFFFVRRIAKYQAISLVSNTLKVITRRSSASNSICCSQNLSAVGNGFTLPATLIGSTAVFSVADSGNGSEVRSLSMTYQWQQKGRGIMSWTNIPNANSKDYLPPAFTSQNTNTAFRRLAVFNVTYWSTSQHLGYWSFPYTTYSNTVNITTPRAGTRNKIRYNENIKDNTEYLIYPNPTSSMLNVFNKDFIVNEKLLIYNQLGQKIELKYINVDENNISIDVSSLQKGIYYLHLGNEPDVVVKKFIKE